MEKQCVVLLLYHLPAKCVFPISCVFACVFSVCVACVLCYPNSLMDSRLQGEPDKSSHSLIITCHFVLQLLLTWLLTSRSSLGYLSKVPVYFIHFMQHTNTQYWPEPKQDQLQHGGSFCTLCGLLVTGAVEVSNIFAAYIIFTMQ